MSTITYVERLSTLHCFKCGIAFAVPEWWETKRRDDHETFYCPNGHAQGFHGKSEAEQLRDQLATKDREIAAAKSRAETERTWRLQEQEQHEHTRRRLNGTRGVVSRMKRRIVAGSCVCCSKKFKDLERHMQSAHPGFDPDKAAEALAAKVDA